MHCLFVVCCCLFVVCCFFTPGVDVYHQIQNVPLSKSLCVSSVIKGRQPTLPSHVVVTVPRREMDACVSTSAGGTAWKSVSAQVSNCVGAWLGAWLVIHSKYNVGSDECKFCCRNSTTCEPFRNSLRPERSSCVGGFCEDVSHLTIM